MHNGDVATDIIQLPGTLGHTVRFVFHAPLLRPDMLLHKMTVRGVQLVHIPPRSDKPDVTTVQRGSIKARRVGPFVGHALRMRFRWRVKAVVRRSTVETDMLGTNSGVQILEFGFVINA